MVLDRRIRVRAYHNGRLVVMVDVPALDRMVASQVFQSWEPVLSFIGRAVGEMTVRELFPLVGLRATYCIGKMVVDVRITDARRDFGTVRVCITPHSGSGLHWVNLETLQLDSPTIRIAAEVCR